MSTRVQIVFRCERWWGQAMAHPTAWLQRQERFLPNLSQNVQTKLYIMLDVTQHRGWASLSYWGHSCFEWSTRHRGAAGPMGKGFRWSNDRNCPMTRIVVGLRFVFHTSLPPDGSSPSINKFPCRIGVWNDRAGWFFSAELPPSTPMSTTKVKCHDMMRELRRSLGPLWHKTYEPLRLKGWRGLWGP